MKHRSLLHMIGSAVCASVLIGCAGAPQDDKPGPEASVMAPAGGGAGGVRAKAPVFANEISATSPGGANAPARVPRRRVVRMDVFQLRTPLGSISRSEEFWKHVDEQSIDVGTYDLLRKNGWRIGIAPTSEWNYFVDIIENYPASPKPTSLTAAPGGDGASLELTMSKGIPYEVVSYFNDENRLFLRSYEECENLINISLQQAPRKPGEARVSVCPTVRGTYRRYQVVNGEKGGAEREYKYERPERLYDLNCEVDVPVDHFFVVAPAPEVKWTTSLGQTFLVQNGGADRYEQILLLVPKVEELEEVTK
jgi:hypothetical protein